jgi:hypothetical protein
LSGNFSDTADFDPGPGVQNLISHGSVAGYGSDAFLLKLDSSGNFIWVRAFGNTNATNGYDLTIDQANNSYITGMFSGSVDFDPDPNNVLIMNSIGGGAAYISKFNSSGTLVWNKTITSVNMGIVQGRSILTDPITGNIDLAGMMYKYINDSTDFDPSASDYILSSFGQDDVFIASFDTSGNFIWAKHIGGLYGEQCGTIDINNSGNIFITGAFDSQSMFLDSITIINASYPPLQILSDVFVAKLDNIITNTGSIIYDNNVLLYPNPAAEKINIELPESNKEYTITITDLSGRLFFKKAYSGNGVNILTKEFPSGAYIMNIQSPLNNISRKFMITK